MTLVEAVEERQHGTKHLRRSKPFRITASRGQGSGVQAAQAAQGAEEGIGRRSTFSSQGKGSTIAGFWICVFSGRFFWYMACACMCCEVCWKKETWRNMLPLVCSWKVNFLSNALTSDWIWQDLKRELQLLHQAGMRSRWSVTYKWWYGPFYDIDEVTAIVGHPWIAQTNIKHQHPGWVEGIHRAIGSMGHL